MNVFFGEAIKTLLESKSQLIRAATASLLSATVFGAGLGMLVPAFTLLLERQTTLPELITEYLVQPGLPTGVQALGIWLTSMIPADPFRSFATVVGAICVLNVVSCLVRYHGDVLTNVVLTRVTAVWRTRIFHHLLRLPVLTVSQLGSAESINRLLKDSALLSNGYRAVIGKPAFRLLRGLSALTVALLLNWQFTLIVIVSAPPMILIVNRLRRRTHLASQDLLVEHGHLLQIVQESLLGIRVVKIHGAPQGEEKQFDFANASIFGKENLIQRTKSLATAFVTMGYLLVLVTMGCIGAWYVFRLNISSSRFIAVVVSLVAAANGLKELARITLDVDEADAAASRLSEVLSLRPESSSGVSLPRHQQSISFENVRFTYPGRVCPALDSVNLTAQYGQLVALVGLNGSGKSTLVNLIPRLLEPDEGRLLIDDVDISSTNLASLREQIGIVPQEMSLFEGTIYDNIVLGQPGISRLEVEEAAHTANAFEFVRELPYGLDTHLGELGTGLSTGQKQRIAFARAILRNPAILILDEPTNQIDKTSVVLIRNAIDRLRRNRTVFLVDHDLETIIKADLIVVMEAGRVTHSGTHLELVASSGTYRRLTAPEFQAG